VVLVVEEEEERGILKARFVSSSALLQARPSARLTSSLTVRKKS
jgi:hypothetical protein